MAAVITTATLGLGLTWRAASVSAVQAPGQAAYTAAREILPELCGLGCIAGYHETDVKECVLGDPDAAKTVVLFGDSHAVQWSPALSVIAATRGWRLVTMVKSACPPPDVEFFYPAVGRVYRECAVWRERAVDRIRILSPATVLVASSDGYARAGHGQPLVQRDDWASGTRRTLESLAEAATIVVHFRDTPRPGFDSVACLSRAAWTGDWFSSERCSFRRDEGLDEELYALEREAAVGYDNVEVLDMTDVICPDEICQTEEGGQVLYRDSNHLTGSYVLALTDPLDRRLEPMVEQSPLRGTPVTERSP